MVSKRSLRWRPEDDEDQVDSVPQTCPLCDRLLVPGPTVDEHHLVPKSQGGREKHLLHRVCHRKIHQVFKPRELAKHYASWAALRSHPEIDTFVTWVQKRPPEFDD